MKFRCRKWLCPASEHEVEVDDDEENPVGSAAHEYCELHMQRREGLSFIEVLTDPPTLRRVACISFVGVLMFVSEGVTEEQARAQIEKLVAEGYDLSLKPGVEA